MVAERFLLLATTLTLAAALPLSLVAIRGFRGAPFARLLTPIPIVLAAYIALNVPSILTIETPAAYDAAISTVAVCAALAAAIRGMRLLGGRREL